jgi:tripartite-type tricarboxylate transporter receptor subunit TctC
MRIFRWLALTALLLPLASAVHAQESWPNRPLRLVVPVVPGGGIDTLTRLVAERMSGILGHPFIIENVSGASGTIAAANVARSAPDGYTFLIQSVSAATNLHIMKGLSYDPLKDLVPVTLVARIPMVAVINSEIPARNMAEFIALLKANPGKYSYGSSGVGTIVHIAGELLKSSAGVDMVHIPYRGGAAATLDLLAGRVALTFDGIMPQLSNIQSGKVRALAVMGAERLSILPDVPAIVESIPGYDLNNWIAIFAPALTPQNVIERVAKAANIAAKDPGLIRRFAELGATGVGSSPDEMKQYWQQQVDYYGKVIAKSNIQLGQ